MGLIGKIANAALDAAAPAKTDPTLGPKIEAKTTELKELDGQLKGLGWSPQDKTARSALYEQRRGIVEDLRQLETAATGNSLLATRKALARSLKD